MECLSILALLVSILSMWGAIEKTMHVQRQVDELRVDLRAEIKNRRRLKVDDISKQDLDNIDQERRFPGSVTAEELEVSLARFSLTTSTPESKSVKSNPH